MAVIACIHVNTCGFVTRSQWVFPVEEAMSPTIPELECLERSIDDGRCVSTGNLTKLTRHIIAVVLIRRINSDE